MSRWAGISTPRCSASAQIQETTHTAVSRPSRSGIPSFVPGRYLSMRSFVTAMTM